MHQFSQPEETRAAPPLSGEPTVAVPLTESDAPRYDAQTIQQVIALAEQMQTRHRETMTPDAVEALAAEVGVEPEFVRQALRQIEARPKNTQAAKHSQATATRWQKVATFLPFALYLLLIPLIPFLPGHGVIDRYGHQGPSTDSYSHICTFFFFVLPAFLAFGVGFHQQSKRNGAKVGALYGLAAQLALAAVALYSYLQETHRFAHQGMSLSQAITIGAWIFVLCLGTWLGTGALLGMGGAVLRKKISGRKVKKRASPAKPPSDSTMPTGDWV